MTYSDRVRRLYNSNAQHGPGAMADSIQALAKLGIAALDTGANIDITPAMQTLLETIGALAAELEEELETRRVA